VTLLTIGCVKMN